MLSLTKIHIRYQVKSIYTRQVVDLKERMSILIISQVDSGHV